MDRQQERINAFLAGIRHAWQENSTVSSLRHEIERLQSEQSGYKSQISHYAQQRADGGAHAEIKLSMAQTNHGEATAHSVLLEYRLRQATRCNHCDINGAAQIQSLRNHPLIEAVAIVDGENEIDAITIKTQEIVTSYLNPERQCIPINMGKYKIRWHKANRLPCIVNRSYDFLEHAHPCVRNNTVAEGSNVCTGEYETVFRQYALAQRFDLLVDTTLHFVKNLDTPHPYRNINAIVADMRQHGVDVEAIREAPLSV